MRLWYLQRDHPVKPGIAATVSRVPRTSKVHFGSFKAHRRASGWTVFKDIFSRKQPDSKHCPFKWEERRLWKARENEKHPTHEGRLRKQTGGQAWETKAGKGPEEEGCLCSTHGRNLQQHPQQEVAVGVIEMGV